MTLVIAARPKAPPPDVVSALQLITALAVPPAARLTLDGEPSPYRTARQIAFITEVEAEGWIARSALPASTLTAIAALPEAAQTAARFGALGMTSAHRLSPIITAAMAIAQADENERDELFRFAATLFPDP